MSDGIERELGALEARLGSVERELRELSADVKTIRDTLAQAKGGWRTLVIVAGLSGALSALTIKGATVLGLLPK
ncbi:MAG: hypothetical protein ACREGL_08285 [Alphaproteobacteria bacterium]